MKLELKKPVMVGETGAPVTTLVFREEVVAGDLRGLKFSEMNDMKLDDVLKIAGRLCGQPDVVMNRLSLFDAGEVTKFVLPLLQDGPETGTSASP